MIRSRGWLAEDRRQVVVHKDVEIDGPTRAGDTDEKPGHGPIRLQDHGHPVQFRNIWIVPAK